MAFRGLHATVFSAFTALLLAIPAAALAATPTDDVYDPVDARTQAAASSSAHTSSGLPFTGLDIAIVVIAGLAILATGLLIRRATRPD